MGCDIHLFVEKRNQEGKWEIVAPPIGGKSYRYDWPRSVKKGLAYLEPEDPEDGAESETPFLQRWFGARNYALFSILANVRNDSDITYLSVPRGVPADASREYELEAGVIGNDGHSHSYFTLHELTHMLEEVREIPTHGIVKASHVMECAYQTPNPDFHSWCKHIFGAGIQILSQEEFLSMSLAERTSIAESDRNYVEWSWTRPVEDILKEFNTLVQEIKDVNPGVPPADLRIVFYFDN